MSVKDFYPTIDPVFGSDFSITKQIPPNPPGQQPQTPLTTP
jgi:hypothetical protein